MYTTVLGKSDNDFWTSTPRKIFSQLDCYNNAKNGMKRAKTSNSGSTTQNSTDGLKETKKMRVLDD